MRSPLLFLLVAPLWAAVDANDILKSMIEAENRNGKLAEEYTHVQVEDHVWYEKTGEKRKSETKEIVFVEGLPYYKLVARDGKPLDAADQAKEDKKLRDTALERRKSRLSHLTHTTFTTGSDDELLTLFNNQLAGQDTINGRKVWVVESTPKPASSSATKHEKEVLSLKHKLWIDQQDHIAIRKVDTVVGPGSIFPPGGIFTTEQQKIHDDVWVLSTYTIDGRVQFVKVFGGPVRTEVRCTDYKKFDVKSTITPE